MSFRSNNVDRLSSLPDEVLSHILSLMPTKFAVRSSCLSKRWKHIWTLVTNLDFIDYHPGNGLNCASTYVDRVLESCKTPQLNSLRLGLFRLSGQKQPNVSKWINEAIRLNVRNLDIQVRSTELPLNLFTCKTLTKLRLVVNYDDLDVFDVSSPIMLPGLKTLDLRVCSKPSVNMLKFIHGCPVLENLSMVITWPNNEELYNFNIPTLKRLELKSIYSLIKVVLNVPNLEYLFVGGQSCPRFVMEDLSSLVEATVFFHDLKDFHEMAELLKGLSGVTSLSWFTSTPNDFVHTPLPKFFHLKRLELKGSFQSPWLLVIQILENSDGLEHLSFEELEGFSWIEPQSIPICMFSKLKTIKITKCKGRKCDIQFLEFMLRHSEVLKTLTIICGSLYMKEEMQMCARLLKFPRASRFCEINFVGKYVF